MTERHPLGSRVLVNRGYAGASHYGTVLKHANDDQAYVVRMHDTNIPHHYYLGSELAHMPPVMTSKDQPSMDGWKVGDKVECLLDWPRTGTIEKCMDGEVPHGVLPDGKEEIQWAVPSEMRRLVPAKELMRPTLRFSQPFLKYSEDQARDDHGRWTSGGGSSASEQSKPSSSSGQESKPQPFGVSSMSQDVQQHLGEAIDEYLSKNGPITEERGSALLVKWLAENHKDELLSIIDKTPADQRPSVLLRKGDEKAGVPSIWLLGWSKDEGTDIHDHFESTAGISVLRGEVVNRIYGHEKNYIDKSKTANGAFAPKIEQGLHAGSTVSIVAPYIHEMFGRSTGKEKRDVTVHAYYPPLTKMHYFKLDKGGKLHYDGEWDEAKPPSEYSTRKNVCGCCAVPEMLLKYSEDQARDDHGRWSAEGGDSGNKPSPLGAPTANANVTQAALKEKAALTSVKTAIERSPEGRDASFMSDYGNPKEDDIAPQPYNLPGHELMVRDFGKWVDPPGIHEDDYDWQIPTKETVQAMNRIIATAEKAHPEVALSVRDEEKRWITIRATVKAKNKATKDGPVDEPRDDHGRWSAGGSDSGSKPSPLGAPDVPIPQRTFENWDPVSPGIFYDGKFSGDIVDGDNLGSEQLDSIEAQLKTMNQKAKDARDDGRINYDSWDNATNALEYAEEAVASVNEKFTGYVAMDKDGSMRGGALLHMLDDGNAKLDYLGSFQRGVGSALLQKAEQYGASHGARFLKLVSTDYAEPFYLKHGFRPDNTHTYWTKSLPVSDFKKQMTDDDEPLGVLALSEEMIALHEANKQKHLRTKAGFDPDQPRDETGKWDEAGGGGSGDHKPSDSGSGEGNPPLGEDTGPGAGAKPLEHVEPTQFQAVHSIDEAIKLIGDGKGVMFERPEEVVTLLDKMNELVQDALAKGEKAPIYDLCKVSVKGTNFFCSEAFKIPRIEMPQLAGKPLPGSIAESWPRNRWGEVDGTEQFKSYLESQGVKVERVDLPGSRLRASQNEMNGSKVAAIVKVYEKEGVTKIPMFTSRENYVLDGHHRWAATVALEIKTGGAREVYAPAYRINLPVFKALKAATDWARRVGLQSLPIGKSLKGVVFLGAAA